MIFPIIKIFFISCLGFITTFVPFQLSSSIHSWVYVPSSKYGEQIWDKNSIQLNEDGTIRVLSKFIPKVKSEITEDIFYTMDINCFEKTFRDVSVGSEDLNVEENNYSQWKYPNGDKLILGVINGVCKIN